MTSARLREIARRVAETYGKSAGPVDVKVWADSLARDIVSAVEAEGGQWRATKGAMTHFYADGETSSICGLAYRANTNDRAGEVIERCSHCSREHKRGLEVTKV